METNVPMAIGVDHSSGVVIVMTIDTSDSSAPAPVAKVYLTPAAAIELASNIIKHAGQA